MGWFEKIFGKDHARAARKADKKRLRKIDDEFDRDGEPVPLEKGDFFSMIIAAFITFAPAIIILAVLLFGSLWLFSRVW